MKPDATAEQFIVEEPDWETLFAVFEEFEHDPPAVGQPLSKLHYELKGLIYPFFEDGAAEEDAPEDGTSEEELPEDESPDNASRLSRDVVTTLAYYLMGRRSDPDLPTLGGKLEGWQLRDQLRGSLARAGRYVVAQSTDS